MMRGRSKGFWLALSVVVVPVALILAVGAINAMEDPLAESSMRVVGIYALAWWAASIVAGFAFSRSGRAEIASGFRVGQVICLLMLASGFLLVFSYTW